MTTRSPTSPGLMERLADGPVICAEGYLFELERRGYLQAGAFVPEVVSDHPDVVRQLHQDFVHAGSDVVEALTYYAHREKMRLIGREDELEPMNRQALRIAKDVAAETGALVAGNICNTNIYEPDDAPGQAKIRDLYAEQMEWIVDEGVDFVIAETFPWQGEAELALDAIKQSGLPAVVTYAIHRDGLTREGNTPAQACKTLEDQGAAVVGLNCTRGPETMLPILQEIAAVCTVPIAALPVPFRTSESEPTFQSLTDPCHGHPDGDRSFPVHLDPMSCTRMDIARFTTEAQALGVKYFGVCCGAGPHHIRAMAEALGRRPPASRYSADMSKHYALGDFDRQRKQDRDFRDQL
ncbi:MAG: homocysteine S-methyltransferase family protein [Proteobacteria bacterium]|nr:homocysteine S-methyltransferase family protein [Pseudomonadota bacterium]